MRVACLWHNPAVIDHDALKRLRDELADLHPRVVVKRQGAGKRFPSAWVQYDQFRQDRGQNGLPDWPDWCYCPMAGAYAILSGGGQRSIPAKRARSAAFLAICSPKILQTSARHEASLAMFSASGGGSHFSISTRPPVIRWQLIIWSR